MTTHDGNPMATQFFLQIGIPLQYAICNVTLLTNIMLKDIGFEHIQTKICFIRVPNGDPSIEYTL